jgi:hypothetical protein
MRINNYCKGIKTNLNVSYNKLFEVFEKNDEVFPTLYEVKELFSNELSELEIYELLKKK